MATQTLTEEVLGRCAGPVELTGFFVDEQRVWLPEDIGGGGLTKIPGPGVLIATAKVVTHGSPGNSTITVTCDEPSVAILSDELTVSSVEKSIPPGDYPLWEHTVSFVVGISCVDVTPTDLSLLKVQVEGSDATSVTRWDSAYVGAETTRTPTPPLLCGGGCGASLADAPDSGGDVHAQARADMLFGVPDGPSVGLKYLSRPIGGNMGGSSRWNFNWGFLLTQTRSDEPLDTGGPGAESETDDYLLQAVVATPWGYSGFARWEDDEDYVWYCGVPGMLAYDSGEEEYTFTPIHTRDRFVFDVDGLFLRARIDGKAFTIGLGDDDEIETITDPWGNCLTFTYSSGALAGVESNQGARATFVYDAGGNVTEFRGPGGCFTTYAYDSSGYDTGGLLTGATDAEGYERTYTYDDRGFLAGATDGEGYHSFYSVTWDADNIRLAAHTNPLEDTENQQHVADQLLSSADPLDDVVSLGYDFSDGGMSSVQPTTVTDPLGHVTTFVYDSLGNTCRVVDARGYTTTSVSYTHLRAHETVLDLVCRLLLEKKKNKHNLSLKPPKSNT